MTKKEKPENLKCEYNSDIECKAGDCSICGFNPNFIEKEHPLNKGLFINFSTQMEMALIGMFRCGRGGR